MKFIRQLANGTKAWFWGLVCHLARLWIKPFYSSLGPQGVQKQQHEGTMQQKRLLHHLMIEATCISDHCRQSQVQTQQNLQKNVQFTQILYTEN